MQIVNMHEAKTHFSKLVEAVTGGEEIVVAKAGKPAARLVPIDRGKRQGVRFGLMKGEIVIAEDFDAPLPDDLLQAFEGESSRLLLDTHVLLWVMTDDSTPLPGRTRNNRRGRYRLCQFGLCLGGRYQSRPGKAQARRTALHPATARCRI